jgi:EAL domain-containing protein (putative c-di-GMP-specific phosphodiesterase class I)
LCESNGTSALVRAILSLAHSLGLQVVAEGVEREEQAEALVAMKCDIMQGFLFAPPRQAQDIPALLRLGHAPTSWKAAPARASV